MPTCARGHEQTDDSTYLFRGTVRCRKCHGRPQRACSRGHEYTEATVRFTDCSDGVRRRYCLICDRENYNYTPGRTELPDWRDDERWLPVLNWEGMYSVSDHGRVRSESRLIIAKKGHVIRYQGRLLKQCLRKDGRLEVGLRPVGNPNARLPTKRQVHRMVLEAFVGPRPKGLVCCHWDDVPTNNRLSNLRWDTPAENEKDKARNAARRMPIEELRAILAERELELSLAA